MTTENFLMERRLLDGMIQMDVDSQNVGFPIHGTFERLINVGHATGHKFLH